MAVASLLPHGSVVAAPTQPPCAPCIMTLRPNSSVHAHGHLDHEARKPQHEKHAVFSGGEHDPQISPGNASSTPSCLVYVPHQCPVAMEDEEYPNVKYAHLCLRGCQDSQLPDGVHRTDPAIRSRVSPGPPLIRYRFTEENRRKQVGGYQRPRTQPSLLPGIGRSPVGRARELPIYDPARGRLRDEASTHPCCSW